MESLMTLKEVASYLRCSQITIRRMIKDKKINALKVGRRYLFERKEVLRVLEEQ